MRVDINLASQPYEDARRFWLRWGAGLVALGILTLLLMIMTVNGWMGARKDRQLIRQYEQQSAARDKEKADAQALLNLPQNTSTRDRSQFLNDLFQRKSFSWTRAFEDLEKVMPPRLHVISIHPELNADNALEIKVIVAGDTREHALDLVSKWKRRNTSTTPTSKRKTPTPAIPGTRCSSTSARFICLRAGAWAREVCSNA